MKTLLPASSPGCPSVSVCVNKQCLLDQGGGLHQPPGKGMQEAGKGLSLTQLMLTALCRCWPWAPSTPPLMQLAVLRSCPPQPEPCPLLRLAFSLSGCQKLMGVQLLPLSIPVLWETELLPFFSQRGNSCLPGSLAFRICMTSLLIQQLISTYRDILRVLAQKPQREKRPRVFIEPSGNIAFLHM